MLEQRAARAKAHRKPVRLRDAREAALIPRRSACRRSCTRSAAGAERLAEALVASVTSARSISGSARCDEAVRIEAVVDAFGGDVARRC